MMPITSPAPSALSDATSSPNDSPDAAQDRTDRERREVAVHDGGDAGEDLEHRLRVGAQTRARVLGQVDRRHQPDRNRDQHRDPRDQQRAREQRHGTERARTIRLDPRGWPSAGSSSVRTGSRAARPGGRIGAPRTTPTEICRSSSRSRRATRRSAGTRSRARRDCAHETTAARGRTPTRAREPEHEHGARREVAAQLAQHGVLVSGREDVRAWAARDDVTFDEVADIVVDEPELLLWKRTERLRQRGQHGVAQPNRLERLPQSQQQRPRGSRTRARRIRRDSPAASASCRGAGRERARDCALPANVIGQHR